MKKITLVISAITALLMINHFLYSCKENKRVKETDLQAVFHSYAQQSIDSLLMRLDTVTIKLEQGSTRETVTEVFLNSRMCYKKIEPLIEYYFQGLTRRINGPALPDIKTEDGVVWPPHGLQKIEELIFDNPIDSVMPELLNEIKVLQTDLRFVKTNLKLHHVNIRHIYEMQQQQLIRIAALGITGFDAPISFNSLPEAQNSLEGIVQLAVICDQRNIKDIKLLSEKAVNYIAAHKNFENFDRLSFITDYLMPLSNAYALLAHSINDNDSLFVKPFKGTFTQLMQGKGFNPDFYAAYEMAASNKAKIELGRKLFFDVSLSKRKNQSCGTCHHPVLYYTDGNTKASNKVHGGDLLRNTPTLLYASLQAKQFYDLRSTTLEDQIHDVIQSKNEFDFSTEMAIERIAKDTSYNRLLHTAFGKSAVTSFELRNAIAAFVRSLNSFSSDFDRFMNGDKEALSAEQKRGFNLFSGKAKCATCHFIPVFNGTVPPNFTNSESEVIGVPQAQVWNKATVSSDSGRYFINQIPELMFAFKTPTVRNVVHTAPYMHNGVYKSLDDVLTFYEKGGGSGIGIGLEHQTLPFDSLQVSVQDKKAIIAFLQALSDKKVP